MTINEMKQSYKQSYTDNVELSIFNCGREQCQPGHTWGPGVRDHYLIHLVVSGKGIFEVGGRTWEVSEGDLFFARPSQLIRYTADELAQREADKKAAEDAKVEADRKKAEQEALPQRVADLEAENAQLKEQLAMQESSMTDLQLALCSLYEQAEGSETE